jgi:TolB-like protein/Tfp pilus assembly protein PilF
LRGDPRFQALLVEPVAAVGASSSAKATEDGLGLASPPNPNSVAVLAFANLSDDKANEYFSDGISEELLNVLAKVQGLKVTARTSSFHFKGKDTAIPEIARQLGVAYVIEGSVRKQGDKVRITAQLIKAADGFHVWSDTFTRDLKDIFAVQDEIAGLIAQQLQLKLTTTDRAKRVVNPEAYRLVLEGRQFWNLRTEEGFAKAETAFSKSLTIDPQFAEAHAGLAGVYVIRSEYRELDGIAIDADDLQRADSEGRRALEIDPTSAEAHAALGHVDYLANLLRDSDRHYQQALTFSPNSALVHCWYALLLSAQGRLDASLQHYQQAAELDPLWFINLHMLGRELALAQRFDQSLGIIERAAALRTEIFLPNSGERARALLELGRKEEAFEAARLILRHPDDRPRWHSDAVAIRVLWKGGRRQEAEDESARLFTRWPPDSYLRGFTLVALGRFDEALAFLKHTPSSMVRSLYWESMWDPWREDPRFAQLLARLGRAEEYKVGREALARLLKESGAKK